MNGLPKVLVFTITYEGKDYCLDEFIENTKKLTYPNYKHIFIDNTTHDGYYKKLKEKLEPLGIDVYHISRGKNSREALAMSQLAAREVFLEGDYDYLFSLESDIMAPPETLEGLISWGKEVVTGLYTIGQGKVRVPCITLLDWHKKLGVYGTRLLKPEELSQYLNAGLKQVAAGGFGCCLMSRRVVELCPFYYDVREELKGHSDIYFFNDMFKYKVPVYVDTDCVCDHRNSSWDIVKDR